jgi:acid phosphatase type 7
MPNRRTFLRRTLALGGVTALGLSGRALAVTPPRDLPAQPPLTIRLTPDLYETLLLTWAGNPCTTMRVQWLAIASTPPAPITIACVSETDGLRHSLSSRLHPFGPRADVWVHRVDFTGLTPDTTYRLELPGLRDPASHFVTAPAHLDRKITFIAGGDINVVPEALLMHATVLREDPLFAVVGGDLAYGNGVNADKEIAFYRDWCAGLITADGRRIPMVAAIGNHEVAGSYGKTRAEAPYFYALFDHWADATTGAYDCLDFGDYLSLVLLDTDHTCPVAAQTDWLRTTLAARPRVPHVFPIYHVPAYPSVRNFEGRISAEIRDQWCPLFENSPQVRVAFEHHDHAFKRTHPLVAGRIAPPAQGVVYLGDGSWGLARRPLREQGDLSLFAQRAEKFHVWRVDLTGDHQAYTALDERGNIIDRFAHRLAST